jgi:hypothetical protein
VHHDFDHEKCGGAFLHTGPGRVDEANLFTRSIFLKSPNDFQVVRAFYV